MKPEILYFFDPLCGWCYGFSDHLTDFFKQRKNEFDFTVFSGGMITGERVGPVGAVAPYIRKAYRDVEERTGVVFGESFLNNILAEGTAIFDSVPPSRLFTAVKRVAPDEAVLCASRLQKAIYSEGIEPTDVEAMAKYLSEMDPSLDVKKLLEVYEEDETNRRLNNEFAYTAKLGIGGFPTVLLFDGKQLYLVARGFVSTEDLNARVDGILASVQSDKER